MLGFAHHPKEHVVQRPTEEGGASLERRVRGRLVGRQTGRRVRGGGLLGWLEGRVGGGRVVPGSVHVAGSETTIWEPERVRRREGESATKKEDGTRVRWSLRYVGRRASTLEAIWGLTRRLGCFLPSKAREELCRWLAGQFTLVTLLQLIKFVSFVLPRFSSAMRTRAQRPAKHARPQPAVPKPSPNSPPLEPCDGPMTISQRDTSQGYTTATRSTRETGKIW